MVTFGSMVRRLAQHEVSKHDSIQRRGTPLAIGAIRLPDRRSCSYGAIWWQRPKPAGSDLPRRQSTYYRPWRQLVSTTACCGNLVITIPQRSRIGTVRQRHIRHGRRRTFTCSYTPRSGETSTDLTRTFRRGKNDQIRREGRLNSIPANSAHTGKDLILSQKSLNFESTNT